MREDKQQILTALGKAMKLTRGYADLEEIHYEENPDGSEYAVVRFKDEYFKVEITADSGDCVLYDVISKMHRIMG